MGLNVDLLLKDELFYELIWRGIYLDSGTTVVNLRKKLREAVKSESTVSFDNLRVLKVSQEFVQLKSKYADVKELVSQVVGLETQDVIDPLKLLRVENRLEHFKNRVNNLLDLSETLLGGLDRALIESYRADALKWEVDVQNVRKGVNIETLESSVRKLSQTNEEEEQKLDDNGDSVFTAGHFAKGDVMNSSFEVKSVDNFAFAVHKNNISDLSLYSKLSNPIEQYLKEIPYTNGLDQLKLLQFLKVVLKLSKVTDLKRKQIVDLSLPYTSDPLQSKLQQLSQCGSRSIKELQKGIVSYFIPKGRLESLRRDFVHRPQRFGEPLSMYIASIVEQSELLMCEMSESEIVENIVLGISPEERSRLTFVGVPNSIRDLERMCIHTQNVKYLDQERQGRSGSQVRNSRNYEHNRVQNIPRIQEPPGARRYVPNCNYCGKDGHEGRNCWENQRGRGDFQSRGRGRGGFPKNGRGRGDNL